MRSFEKVSKEKNWDSENFFNIFVYNNFTKNLYLNHDGAWKYVNKFYRIGNKYICFGF